MSKNLTVCLTDDKKYPTAVAVGYFFFEHNKASLPVLNEKPKRSLKIEILFKSIKLACKGFSFAFYIHRSAKCQLCERVSAKF